MKITAALCWWDERPDDLEACVRGMAEVADRIIAVDGAYRRYPGATISSPPEQSIRIRNISQQLGVDCEVYVPTKLWAGQVEKRAFLLKEAAKDSNWIAIFDADWIAHGDPQPVRDELERLGRKDDVDVITVPIYTSVAKTEMYATNWHRQASGSHELIPHFFRALPEMDVEKLHWNYSAWKGYRRVWLWHGGNTPMPIMPQYPLKAHYGIEHKTLLRTEQQILASRAFCNDRVMVLALTGQEDDVPGLPEPEFDYETMPY